MSEIRQFETGATRDVDLDKYDYDGFLHPLVIEAYAAYMHRHRVQPDGNLRASDNWKKGIPREAYMKSGWRHFFDWWKEHNGYSTRDGVKAALCALIFNASGYLSTLLVDEQRKRSITSAQEQDRIDDLLMAEKEEYKFALESVRSPFDPAEISRNVVELAETRPSPFEALLKKMKIKS